MDKKKVDEIASRHRQLQVEEHGSDDRNALAAQHDEEMRKTNELWKQLGEECQEFCSCYNAAMGTQRIYCELHVDTIVIRSQDDPQNTVTLNRTLPGPFHPVTLGAHRYHYPARAADLPVGSSHGPGNVIALTYAGEDVSPEDLILQLLSNFTEELARTVRAHA